MSPSCNSTALLPEITILHPRLFELRGTSHLPLTIIPSLCQPLGRLEFIQCLTNWGVFNVWCTTPFPTAATSLRRETMILVCTRKAEKPTSCVASSSNWCRLKTASRSLAFQTPVGRFVGLLDFANCFFIDSMQDANILTKI